MSGFDKIIYISIHFFVGLIGKIPSRCFATLGCALGGFIYFLDRRHRKVALDNLQYAYDSGMSKKFCEKIVRKIYDNLGQLIFEIGWLMKSCSEDVDRRIEIMGGHNLLRAFSKGKGILFVSGHIGAWEVLPYIIARLGIKLNIVYRPLDFKPLDRFVKEFRSMFGGHLIAAKGAMLEIGSVLANGEAVGLLIDQSADWYNGVWVDFFNHRTCTNKGPARIALTNRVPVLPVFAVRRKNGYRIFFKKEIAHKCTGDLTKDIESSTLMYSKIIEAEIRKCPEQWFWIHRRWKNKAYVPWPRSEV